MANAPTPDDIGRVYLHGTTRVVLLNDLAVAVASGDYRVAVKPVDPAPGPGGDTFPVAEVDYRYLTATDERIDPLDMSITDKASARAFIDAVTHPNAPDYVNRPGFPAADEADYASDSGDETIPEDHR